MAVGCRYDYALSLRVLVHSSSWRIGGMPVNATAFALRSPGYAFGVSAYWKPSTGGDAAAQWVSSVSKRLNVDAEGNYVNVMDREDQSAVRRAYAVNYRRLCEVKGRYDSRNLFRHNQNILPA